MRGLVVLLALISTVFAGTPVNAIIRSCSGCSLNRLPTLKNVLHNQLGTYTNLKVNWIQGAVPRAFLYDAQGEEVDAFDLGEKNLEQLIAQFKEHNFVPERIKAQFSGLPLASIDFGGHHYKLFDKNFHPEAVEFTLTQNHNGQKGYLATLTHPLEEKALRQLLEQGKATEGAFLGGSDTDTEGTWLWNDGPESDLQFFKNGERAKDANGTPIDSIYVNWQQGEPNNAGFSEGCLAMSLESTRGWNDIDCLQELKHVIVEFGDSPLTGVSPYKYEPQPETKQEL